MLKAVLTFFPLELCDQGRYAEAAEVAGLRVGEWPDRGSQRDSEHAAALLVAGIITSTVGGIQQTVDRQLGRKMLVESTRLSEPDSHVARFWLAWADYWAGDLDSALILAGEVLNALLTGSMRFRALLLRSTIYWHRELTDQAWMELLEMEAIYDQLDPLLKGKFHNQRAVILRQLKQTDRAAVDYDAAMSFFQDARDVRWQAIIANNLAGFYLETEQFTEAHQYAEHARELFVKLDDKSYTAQTWDQTAQIFLAEGKIEQAEFAVNSGLALVEYGEVLGKLRKTAGKIKHGCGIESQNDHAIISAAPQEFLPNTLLAERSSVMTHLDGALLLIESDPDKALALYDLIVWITSARDDPQHEAEVDEIEESCYLKTEDATKRRAAYRSSRLIHPVTSVDP